MNRGQKYKNQKNVCFHCLFCLLAIILKYSGWSSPFCSWADGSGWGCGLVVAGWWLFWARRNKNCGLWTTRQCGRQGVEGKKKQKVWTGRSRRVGIWAGRHVGSMSAGGHEWARTDGEWKRASTHEERRRAELATAHPWPQIFIVGGKGVRKEVPPTNHETSSWFYPHWLGVWFRFDCWRFHFWVLLSPVFTYVLLVFSFSSVVLIWVLGGWETLETIDGHGIHEVSVEVVLDIFLDMPWFSVNASCHLSFFDTRWEWIRLIHFPQWPSVICSSSPEEFSFICQPVNHAEL